MLEQVGLAGVAGLVLSIFFEWFPWVREKYGALGEQGKRLLMLAALVIVTLAIYGLACIPSSPVHMVTCDSKGAWDLALMVVVAMAGNQSGYSLTKRPSA